MCHRWDACLVGKLRFDIGPGIAEVHSTGLHVQKVPVDQVAVKSRVDINDEEHTGDCGGLDPASACSSSRFGATTNSQLLRTRIFGDVGTLFFKRRLKYSRLEPRLVQWHGILAAIAHR